MDEKEYEQNNGLSLTLCSSKWGIHEMLGSYLLSHQKQKCRAIWWLVFSSGLKYHGQ